MPKNKKFAINSGMQTYQILTNDKEVCIPSLSSILLAGTAAESSKRQRLYRKMTFRKCNLKSLSCN